MASASGKARVSSWASATSLGAGTAEALKDRHAVLRRWNPAFQFVQQRASSSTAAAGNGQCPAGGVAARRKPKNQDEEELRTVMYLTNWGPDN